jgi:hypothetical protein
MVKLIASSNCEDLGINYVVVNKEVVYFGKVDYSDKFKHSEWYKDIIYYLNI